MYACFHNQLMMLTRGSRRIIGCLCYKQAHMSEIDLRETKTASSPIRYWKFWVPISVVVFLIAVIFMGQDYSSGSGFLGLAFSDYVRAILAGLASGLFYGGIIYGIYRAIRHYLHR